MLIDFNIKQVKLSISHICCTSECVLRVQGDISEGFTFDNGVRQGDSIVRLLFNIGLEKVVTE